MQATITVFAVSLAILVTTVFGAVPEDKIDGESLPGWNKELPSAHYSGYIEVNDTYGKYLHYWFAESEEDPESAPVVLWLNGGPGCSSMDGLFNEMGPLHFNRSGYTSGLPQLVYNPWTWTKVANMIFLESPAGVGFSYSEHPPKFTNDDITALENYAFLVNWFEKFPEYKKNDFYIMGESYAGIYVPTLVHTIMRMNERASAEKQINLKSFGVGNGCIGNRVGACGGPDSIRIHVDFYHGHALFPDELYQKIQNECDDYSTISEKCRQSLTEMSTAIGKINIYNIYDVCSMNLTSPYSRTTNHIKRLLAVEGRPTPLTGPFDCIDDHVEKAFFNDAKVRSAIHVVPKSKVETWSICTNVNYIGNTESVLPIYPSIIKKYQTLIFNGDVDGCVPYIGNEYWTSNLGFPVKKGWTAWMVNDQVAGYVTEYEENGFKFVTVKGAGHMVPQYQPKFAYSMFERFMMNKAV